MTTYAHPRECHRVIDRILLDYGELPLRLTTAQAARLWQLETPRVTALLEQLVSEGYLRREADRYVRADGHADTLTNLRLH